MSLFALVGLTSIGLTACVAGGVGNRGRMTADQRTIQEIFIAPGQLQYYLMPQQLVGPTGQYARLDLVVRDSVQALRYGLLHLSVVSPTALSLTTDTLLLSTSGPPLALAAHLLYTEPKGKAVVSRLEAYLTPAQLAAYLRSPAKSLLLGGATGRRCFVPSDKALRNLQLLTARAINLGSR